MGVPTAIRNWIGRGDKPSSCLLLYQSSLGAVAKPRLEILRETEDGFRIAEEDLRRLGAGEMLRRDRTVCRVCGLPTLRSMRSWSRSSMTTPAWCSKRDPHLESARGQALRTLLYLFRRDEAVQLPARRLTGTLSREWRGLQWSRHHGWAEQLNLAGRPRPGPIASPPNPATVWSRRIRS